MKYAICNELFDNWDFARVCSFIKETGYAGVEIAPFTLAEHVNKISPERRREVRAAAEKAGVDILGIHWLLAKVVSDKPLYVTHPDPAVRKDTADYFVELTKLCADLGGRIMVIGSPKARDLMPGVSRDQAMEFSREVFSACLPLAEKHGVTLAIEPLGPAETNFLNSAADGIELIERVNHPHFKLHLDVKAMSSEPTPIPDVIRASKAHTVHFHANDPNLLGPGMGEVKFEPIFAALKETGYDGYVSVEVFDFKPGAERIARESIEYMKRTAG
ncbi:MAG TPA: sugar phosphate isomerase/epimerase family protein [Tepidisphaeraceae bacterium]|nr:sugar phosphate isomerase/epimerase family protein [Tepidisphaeraceae bacterium]